MSWRSRLVLTTLAVIAATPGAVRGDEVADLAARIDAHIATAWEEQQVVPAPVADDTEFLRRAHLHLAGKIPRVAEVRRFLADPSADKRRAVVDQLLESPGYIVNFTNVWRALMIPEAESDLGLRQQVPDFEAWLRQQLTHDVHFDVMVRELITTPTPREGLGRQFDTTPSAAGDPTAFLEIKGEPENVAASVSRLFLGVRLECAQCHDHPFAKWQRKDFWQFTAFFTTPATRGRAVIPETKELVNATYLTGEAAHPGENQTYRDDIAAWLTSRENPYFARATVNRLWYHFFGTGLVDPVDDFGDENPASHPELLDELAREFAAHDFDVKHIIRGIMASRTYQTTSRQTDESQADPRVFAKMAIQGLTTDQLFDSLAEATGYFESNAERDVRLIGNNSERAKFRELFRNEVGGPVDAETTILQALTLMNGEFVTAATNVSESTTLAAVVESPFLSTAERVSALYLATLSRPPNESELATMVAYVDDGGATGDTKTALADVFWVLLNSSEFLFNH